MEMNASIFTELKTLDPEERKAQIRQLLESKDSKIKAVLFDATKQRSVDIFEMADEMGIDKCVDFLSDLIEQSECQSQTLTRKEVEEVFARVHAGKATEEDMHIMNAIMDSMAHSNSHEFHVNLNELIVKLIEFAQKDVNYNPTMADVLGAISILCMMNMINDESCALHKHRNGGPQVVSEIGAQVGEDIYNTWKATLTEELDPSIVLSGILFFALKVAKDANYKFIDSDLLKQCMGVEDDCCDCDGNCDCDGECQCGCENENGSNTNNIAQPVIPFPKKEDQDMRDMLKE